MVSCSIPTRLLNTHLSHLKKDLLLNLNSSHLGGVENYFRWFTHNYINVACTVFHNLSSWKITSQHWRQLQTSTSHPRCLWRSSQTQVVVPNQQLCSPFPPEHWSTPSHNKLTQYWPTSCALAVHLWLRVTGWTFWLMPLPGTRFRYNTRGGGKEKKLISSGAPAVENTDQILPCPKATLSLSDAYVLILLNVVSAMQIHWQNIQQRAELVF